jgi:5-methylcytosine-specific restriction endonuclease McrA
MGKGKVIAAPRTNKWENVRTWFSRFGRMAKCERCGYDDKPGILQVHHKDRDRENNALSNLEVLCPNCHAEEHLEERKSGWKGHKSKAPAKVKARMETEKRRG